MYKRQVRRAKEEDGVEGNEKDGDNGAKRLPILLVALGVGDKELVQGSARREYSRLDLLRTVTREQMGLDGRGIVKQVNEFGRDGGQKEGRPGQASARESEGEDADERE